LRQNRVSKGRDKLTSQQRSEKIVVTSWVSKSKGRRCEATGSSEKPVRKESYPIGSIIHPEGAGEKKLRRRKDFEGEKVGEWI